MREEWFDTDLEASPQEEYDALVRGLHRNKGFGLHFIQSEPRFHADLMRRIADDTSKKKVSILKIKAPTRELYSIVDEMKLEEEAILLVSGIEHSLDEYEEQKRAKGWSEQEIESCDWRGVPPILNHLNQQRERFRDNFKLSFVFLVSERTVKYFIHRAPDFFDWRSGFYIHAES